MFRWSIHGTYHNWGINLSPFFKITGKQKIQSRSKQLYRPTKGLATMISLVYFSIFCQLLHGFSIFRTNRIYFSNAGIVDRSRLLGPCEHIFHGYDCFVGGFCLCYCAPSAIYHVDRNNIKARTTLVSGAS